MTDEIGRDPPLYDARPDDEPSAMTDALALAVVMQAARRRRRLTFPHADTIFREPAWDILLELFIAAAEGRVPEFDALCEAANVRAETGIRWITTLETLKLVHATARPGAAMPQLALTGIGNDAMLTYLSRR